MKQSHRPLSKIIPRGVTWLHDAAQNFEPCENMVYTRNGDKIQYEYMVVAIGINNDYDQVNMIFTFFLITFFWSKVNCIFFSDFASSMLCVCARVSILPLLSFTLLNYFYYIRKTAVVIAVVASTERTSFLLSLSNALKALKWLREK